MPSLRCDCDYLADADTEAGLMAVARAHATDVHEIDLDDDQLLAALARQADTATKE